MDIIPLLVLSFLAAFGGTVAMTVSQEIEIRINKRPVSFTPAVAFFKILHLNFDVLSERTKTVWSYAVHFAYGTFWGFPLVLFFFIGLFSVWPTVFVLLVVTVIQGWVIIPFLGISGPFWTWGLKSILIEIFHKTIYSIVTVYLFKPFISIIILQSIHH